MSEIRMKLGNSTIRAGVVRAALGAFAMAVALAPGWSSAVQAPELRDELQRGIEEIQQGRVEAGLARIEEVIAAEPRLAQAHFYAGMASAQLRRWQQAYDYFVTATEQAPGYGEAHMQACRVAYSMGNVDDAFRHAVLAAQAGMDMTAAFAGLEAAMELPEDWRQRIAVPRVVIGVMDIQALTQQDAAIFGGEQTEQSPAGADQRGSPETNPLAGVIPIGSSGAFPFPIGQSGVTLAAELQAELHEVRRRFGEELVRSPTFGVVADAELADYVLFLKVDDVGEGPQTPLKGFVKLLDPGSGAEIYSRPLELSNINSYGEIRSDVARYVGYMDAWLLEQRR